MNRKFQIVYLLSKIAQPPLIRCLFCSGGNSNIKELFVIPNIKYTCTRYVL